MDAHIHMGMPIFVNTVKSDTKIGSLFYAA